MKKIFSAVLSITLVVFCFAATSCSKDDADNFIDDKRPVIGIAWVPDRNEAFYQNYIITQIRLSIVTALLV